MFDWVPSGGVNVWLRDFGDVADASTYPAPRNRITVEVAPAYSPYETFSSADRFELYAMHEVAHLATMDRASPEDVRFRRFFHGKVDYFAAHPETFLYYYLTVPRAASPRWYLEGSAVFMETWMMGGVGRAQGGYDEMVFRAMVQDHAHFYDPLGLVSKGTVIDFQTGANAYLYGTRFMDYLALTYGPQSLLSWWRRDAGSRRYYADQFQKVYGLPLDQSWRRWIAFEQEFQRKNLAGGTRTPDHAISRSYQPQSRRRVAQLPVEGWQQAVHGREVPGPSRAPRVDLAQRRHRDRAPRDQGLQGLHGHLARLRSTNRDTVLHHE